MIACIRTDSYDGKHGNHQACAKTYMIIIHIQQKSPIMQNPTLQHKMLLYDMF